MLIAGIVGDSDQREYDRWHAPSNTLYTFEVVRHGARAPLVKPEGHEWPFPANEEMLTPSGMRQRYLLGKYHRYKMDSPLGFSANLTHHDYKYMNVKSTDYYRTI